MPSPGSRERGRARMKSEYATLTFILSLQRRARNEIGGPRDFLEVDTN
jgi:hypothetical protein